MNNDIEFECVPNALFKTYGTKKEKTYEYLHSVHKGGLDYVKKVLNRNNIIDVNTEDKVINYINPYDEMIKSDKTTIKEIIKQYENKKDDEFIVDSEDDIEDDIKDVSLYKSIKEYNDETKKNAEKVIKEYFYKHETVENAEKMIKEYFNQYEYNTDHEFDVESVDDIKDERIKNELLSLY